MTRMTSASPRRGSRSASWFRNTRAGSSITSKRSMSVSLQQGRQALQRDVQPVGTIVLLVAQLVEHLLHLREAQQAAHIVEVLVQAAAGGGVGVSLHENFASLLFPFAERWYPLANLDGAAGIAERPQHPRHVAQRRMLAPCL